MSHKIANVLAALPNRRNGAPRPRSPRTRERRSPRPAVTAAEAFAADYGAKWAKAVVKITDDRDVLLAF